MRVAATLVYVAPLLRAPHNLSHWDWDKEFGLAGAQRKAVLDFGEMPLWNPHKVGGMPLFGFHESIALAPEFPLVLALGTVPGMKARIVAAYVVGVLAMSALARRHGARPWAAAVAASIAFLSGYMASHLWFGQPMWVALCWLPVAMLGLHPSRRRPSLVAAAFLAMFFEGGLDVLFMCGLALLVAVAVEGASGSWRGAAAFLRGCALFLLLGALKLLPSAQYIARAPRPTQGPGLGALHQMRGLRQLATALADGSFADQVPWSRGQWEDMAFVGWLALALALAGAIAGGRRLLPWTATVLFCLLMAMGDGGVPGLWSAFHSLPAVDQFEYPLRFAGVGVVPAALLAALALERLAAAPLPHARWLALALGLAAALVPYTATRHVLAAPIFWNPPPPPLPSGPFVQWLPPSKYMDYPSLLMNRGNLAGDVLATYAPVRAIAAGSPRYRGEAWLRDGRGGATVAARSMCRIAVDVDARAPDRLVVNMNHAPGWRANGRPADAQDGLLACDVAPGRTRVQFAYRPRDYHVGLFVSLSTVLALVAAAARRAA